MVGAAVDIYVYKTEIPSNDHMLAFLMAEGLTLGGAPAVAM